MNGLHTIGRLTGEYEVKHLSSGKAVGSFTLAVNDGWGDNEHTSFFDVSVFGKRADEHGKFIGKGSKVGVSGSIRQDRWESNDGQKRSKVKIVAMQIEYLDAKKEGKREMTCEEQAVDSASLSQDEIPF